MTRFETLYERALERKGGKKALNKLLPATKTPAQLAKIPDDRYLAEICRRIFCAGFVWKIVDYKWAGFEEAFYGFDVDGVASLPDDYLDKLAEDARIIRHYRKILSVRENAWFILDIGEEHGGFGRFVADWPEDDIAGLLWLLKKRGSRLGGNSGQYFLRRMGKPTFMLTRDVVACLNNYGILDTDNPTAKRDLEKVQKTFNAWREESGYNLAELSRITSYAVD